VEFWVTKFDLWHVVSYILEGYAVSISWYQEIDIQAKVQAMHSSELFISAYQSKWCYKLEDHNMELISCVLATK
jgi:hypothetical protein